LGGGVRSETLEPVVGDWVDDGAVPVDGDGVVGTSDPEEAVTFGSRVAGASFTASAARVVFTTGFGRATPLASLERRTRRSVPSRVAA
jgi:hypothetical protein